VQLVNALLAQKVIAGTGGGGSTPPPPPPTGSGTWSSGVYIGSAATSAAHTFGVWRGGGDPPVVLDFSDNTWASIEAGYGLAEWKAAGYNKVVFSPWMLPATGATFAAGAAGSYDSHWTALATVIASNGGTNVIVRPGWEMNGDWFVWSMDNTTSANWIAYWRKIVNAMRAVVPGLQFDWCPMLGKQNPEAFYPGDAYVDIIGIDAYNTYGSWANMLAGEGGRVGLNWHRTFAAAHSKPVSFPEWGITDTNNYGFGDNSAYIQNMFDWFASSNMSYECYFEFDAGDGLHNLENGQYPNSAVTYRNLFPPATASTPTDPVPGGSWFRASEKPKNFTPLSDAAATARVLAPGNPRFHVATRNSTNTTYTVRSITGVGNPAAVGTTFSPRSSIPTSTEIADYRARNVPGAKAISYDPPGAGKNFWDSVVTGNHNIPNATTDDIIQWAAHKWGIDEDILRAQCCSETDWDHNLAGDVANQNSGDYRSDSLIQVKCSDWGRATRPLAQKSIGFALDYYGSHYRDIYDGRSSYSWLADYPNEDGLTYPDPPSDGYVWAVLGVWFSGRWWNGVNTPTEPYSGGVWYGRTTIGHYNAKRWLTYPN
jgi:hypothetical protein